MNESTHVKDPLRAHPNQDDHGDDPVPEIGGRNAKYVLFVLVLVYIFNFIDRHVKPLCLCG